MTTNGSEHIVISDKVGTSLLTSLPKPVIYTGKDYGVPLAFTGKNVKISIIDSGTPRHKSIKNIVESVSFYDQEDNKFDEYGHATMVSGFLTANDKYIQGIAPKASLYYAKITNSAGVGDFNALVAGLLWSIVKRADIVLFPIGSNIDYPVLKDAISKAFKSNVCIIAASGDNGNGDVLFPADYDEVLSFKVKPSGRDIKNGTNTSSKIIISMPNGGLPTTINKTEYIKAYGSSFAAALGAGLAALTIEKLREKSKSPVTPRSVYENLLSLKYS